VLRCSCGWELSWSDYFDTIQHKQLSGAEPVLEQFRAFAARFPAAKSPRDKVILIDALIHGFHWNSREHSPTRPVAVNLVEGRLGEVVAFLDAIHGTTAGTPGLKRNHTEWRRNIEINRGWYHGGLPNLPKE